MRKIMAAAFAALAFVPVASATPCYGFVPDWESADDRSTIEIALADFNGDGWQNVVGERKAGDGERHVFYLKHFPALNIAALRVNGSPVPRADYCFDARAGWFSLKNAPPDGARVEVDYRWSNRLDFFAGNETRAQTDNHDVVYFNRDGALEKTPSWLSEERVDTYTVMEADYDADGDVDVAIGGPVFIKIYKNAGAGLEKTPSWSSTIPGGCASCFAWGDVDNDGYLELAAVDPDAEKFYVFKNNAGALEKLPSWAVSYTDANYVAWGDADGDGDMDLAASTFDDGMGGGDGYVYVFKNNAGVLATSPYWRCDPPRGRCSALAWGDVNGDGWLDLVKGICGRWTGGDPYTDIYYSDRGVLPKAPGWECNYYSFCHTSLLVDGDGDGLLDLVQATSSMVGYFRRGGVLEAGPSWKYTPGPPYFLLDARIGDVNGDGYADVAVGCSSSTGRPRGGPNKIILNKGNIGVRVKNFAAAPAARGVALRWEVSEAVAGFNLLREVVAAEAAAEPARINDALITGRSPYRYLDEGAAAPKTHRYWLEVVPLAGPAELHGPVECALTRKAAFALGQNVPNPARAMTAVAFSVPAPCEATLAVYDLAGRRVASRVVTAKAGANEFELDVSALAPGVYTYRLEAAGEAAAKRMVVVR